MANPVKEPFNLDMICFDRKDVLDPHNSMYDNHIAINFRVVEEHENDKGEVVDSKYLGKLDRDWYHVRYSFPSPEFLRALGKSLVEAGLSKEDTRNYLNELCDPAIGYEGRRSASIMMAFTARSRVVETYDNVGKQIQTANGSIEILVELKISEECEICFDNVGNIVITIKDRETKVIEN